MLEYHVIEIKKNKIKNWSEYYIGIRDTRSGLTVYLTDYHRLLYDPQKLLYEDTDIKGTAYCLARFLNWYAHEAPYCFREVFSTLGIEAVTFVGAQFFLDEHAMGRIKGSKGMRGKPGDVTQRIELDRISMFLINIRRLYHPEELEEHWIRERKYGRYEGKYEYELRLILNRKKHNERLERYLPQEIYELLVDAARNYDPLMVLPLLLQRYAGFRQSELCNLRRKESPLGSGYRFLTQKKDLRSKKYIERKSENQMNQNGEDDEDDNDEIITIEFDVLDEYLLRSDGVSTGKIKVSRKQRIPVCIMEDHPEILVALEEHLELLKGYSVEEEFLPLFINNNKKNGKYLAMTSKGYKDRMRRLLETYVYDFIDHSENEVLKTWKRHMMERHWGPHWLRYDYSISLVMDYGYTAAELKEARGDKSIDSSWTYVAKAPQLGKALSESNYLMINEVIRTCEQIPEF